ncbi:hypothetical protein [Mesorhizobium sp.]|nr:hypothetical protein [Mesorhizobium sp.]
MTSRGVFTVAKARPLRRRRFGVFAVTSRDVFAAASTAPHW